MSIVVGFGGNLGSDAEIVARFERAREALAQLGTVRSASLYRSAAIGPEQPAFLNSAVAVAWADVQPAELIATVLEIERLAGRVRPAPRWGPRHIDLDVLWWDAREVRTPELEVPHPRLAERRFALAPLVELLGEDVAIPGRGRAGDLLARVADQAVERIGSW
ncbi:MAG: 2-amino-4-hydroxy-6-hydroxymethyldihydropteridine diphosphokinase [Deltaproteobacteria bacterium]|nr:2-amino-4-hydroxy-6-hydroxymethyldihydropteridine diphosphokinase [Deltaproteobacteria bacterium]